MADDTNGTSAWGNGYSLVGLQGVPGTPGATILAGSGAPPSKIGAERDFYFDQDAAVFFGPKKDGAWPSSGTRLLGPQGTAGIDGATIHSGPSTPDNKTGKGGDFWFSTSTATLYGPRTGGDDGTYPTPGTSFLGPVGPQGEQGPAGLMGSDGRTLHAGPNIPGPGDGTDGDFWFTTSSGTFYGPKVNGRWPEQGVLLKGPPGDVGPKGDTVVGPQGPGFLYGAGAPTDDLGTAGSFYVSTDTWAVYGPRDSTTWRTGRDGGAPHVSLVGPPGPRGDVGPASSVPGPQGRSTLAGRGAPNGTIGQDGDLYVDLDGGTLWPPKSNGVWQGPPTSLLGPPGPKGDVGAASTVPGPQGATLRTGQGQPPNTLGNDGDVYVDLAGSALYPAKSNGVWAAMGTSLVGPQGATGAQGVAGSILRYGNGTPTASTFGNNGDFYIDQTNSRLFGPRVSGAWPTMYVTLVGPTGADGSSIRVGQGAPANTVGNVGDLYFDQTNGYLYPPKTSTGWGSTYTTLRGVDGAPGAKGDTGPAGPLLNDFTANSYTVVPVSGSAKPAQVAVKNSGGTTVFLADTAGNVTASGVATVGSATVKGGLSVGASASVAGALAVTGGTTSANYIVNNLGNIGAPAFGVYGNFTGNANSVYASGVYFGSFGQVYEFVCGYGARNVVYENGSPGNTDRNQISHNFYTGIGSAADIFKVNTGAGVALKIKGDGSAAILAGLTLGGGLTFPDGSTLATATVANQTKYTATQAGTAAGPAFGFATTPAGIYFDTAGNCYLSVNGAKSLYSVQATGAADGASGWAIASTLGAGKAVLAIFGNGGTTATTSVDGAGAVTTASATVGALKLTSGGTITFGDGTTMATAASGTGGGGGTASGSQLRYGTGAPTTTNPAQQSDGDAYIDVQQAMYYGPRANGTWPSPVSMIGPTGPRGPTGADGAAGASTSRSWVKMGTYWNTGLGANVQGIFQDVVQSGSTVGQTPASFGAARPGSVVGYSLNQVGPVSGNFTFYIMKNGTSIYSDTAVGSGIKQFSKVIAPGTVTFAAGDALGVAVSTSGSGNLQALAHLEILT